MGKTISLSHVMRILLSGLLLVGTVIPDTVWACACGCGVFEVGTSAMFPTHPGGMAFLEYDHMNQNRNWSGTSPSTADNNSDKELLTDFFTVGYQYMFDRRWGVMAELPYTNRYFKTTDSNGDVVGFNHSAVGDIRLRVLYTRFSDDMSTGLNFGIKLPTGDYTYPNFDPDTEIGTGSTDILLGAYHQGQVPAVTSWNWFINGQVDQPILNAGGYRPGSQIDAAGGAYYNRWHLGGVKIAPLAQVIESYRWRDSGTLAHSGDSGYERILLAPSFEVDTRTVRVYADVGFPVLQNVNGNQLVASQLLKLNVSYHF
jgi:hypothetical protein